MDRRIQRTQNSIINAFIEMRAQTPIEKISVKELADKAMINKATFYLHYKDIYDLEEILERELIQSVLKSLPDPEAFVTDPHRFSEDLTRAFVSQGQLLQILLSFGRTSYFIDSLEAQMKDFIFEKNPMLRHNMEVNIAITFLSQGAFHTVMQKQKYDIDKVLAVTSKITEQIIRMYRKTEN